jgi:hypothetical protein
MKRLYAVWLDEEGQDADGDWKTMAYDSEFAALEWAEEYDRNNYEYGIAGGETVIAIVRDIESGETTRYVISAENEPSYYAWKS